MQRACSAFAVDRTPAADHHRAMCGRFLLNSPLVELQRAFRFPERPNLGPRYNVAPTQTVPIVRRRRDGEGRELALVRWGLVPFWAKDLSIGSKLINARAEGIESKPAFKAAFKARRCLVPANGFYEWQKVDGGKQPMLIRLRSGELFGFAGLWETWREPEGPVDVHDRSTNRTPSPRRFTTGCRSSLTQPTMTSGSIPRSRTANRSGGALLS